MRQVGILAAAGLVGLEKVVPLLPKDHERTKRIAEGKFLSPTLYISLFTQISFPTAIDQLRSPNIVVDFPNVHTNILLIQTKQPKLTAKELADRLAIVEPEEIAAGVTDKNGAGIVVKSSARDWEFMRLVLYNQVDDEQVELSIKKLTYVIKQYDARWP